MPETETIVIRRSGTPERRWIDRCATPRGVLERPVVVAEAQLAQFLNGTSPVESGGVTVDERTALGVAAFWCAATMIAADVAALPLFLWKSLPGGGSEHYTSHPLNYLFHDRPNSETTKYSFIQALMLNALTGGNGFAEVTRGSYGQPLAIYKSIAGARPAFATTAF